MSFIIGYQIIASRTQAKVVEFNCRFVESESQVVVPALCGEAFFSREVVCKDGYACCDDFLSSALLRNVLEDRRL